MRFHVPRQVSVLARGRSGATFTRTSLGSGPRCQFERGDVLWWRCDRQRRALAAAFPSLSHGQAKPSQLGTTLSVQKKT